jgi:hypothetical protein
MISIPCIVVESHSMMFLALYCPVECVSLSGPLVTWRLLSAWSRIFMSPNDPHRPFMTPHLKNHEDSNKTTINSDLLITFVCIDQYERWVDDPTCERCLQEDKSATHILRDCEAIAYLRFCHLGQFFMEPSDCYDAPIIKALHFIRSVGLIKG